MSVEASDRLHNVKAVQGTPGNPKICYCKYCGEYLGDLVDYKLWKNGKVVLQVHRCSRGQINGRKTN